MNRLIILSFLVIGMMAGAQPNQLINRKLQLNNVPAGSSNDKFLVRGVDKVVKEVTRASIATGISEAPTDGQNYVRNNGNWIVPQVSQSSSQNFQQTINNGNKVVVNSLDSDSYFSFGTNGAIDPHIIKAGFDGLTFGSGYNTNSERFFNVTKNSLTFGSGLNSIIFGADVLNVPGGGQRYVTIPAGTGKVVLVRTDAPSSANDDGVVGEVRITANYIYICTAPNSWVRSAVSTW